MGFGLRVSFGSLGLYFFDGFVFGDFLIAAALRLIGGGSAELFTLGSDEFLLSIDLHLDVFLVLAVELSLLLLITQLTDEVVAVADLLVLDLKA